MLAQTATVVPVECHEHVDNPPRHCGGQGEWRLFRDDFEPGTTRLERLLGFSDGPFIAACSGSREVILELRDRIFKLTGEPFRASALFGIFALPTLVFASTDRSLDLS